MDFITDAQAVLQRVVAKLGDAAASQLGLTQAAFVRMLDGREALPTHVLLRAVDIVLDEKKLAALGREGKHDRGAGAGLALRPDAPTMGFDDAAAYVQHAANAAPILTVQCDEN